MTKRRKLQLPCMEVKKHFRDYCASTSVHGIKYLGEKGRPKVERIWWTFVFALTVLGFAYMINKMWQKWNESPVIVSFAEPTPLWDIPFPAVTICSEIKNTWRILKETERCESSSSSNVNLTTECSKFTDKSTTDMIKEVNEMLWLCKWKMSDVNCSELFTPVFTEEGLCFSFNSLRSTEIYRDAVVQDESRDNKTKTKSKWTQEKDYSMSTLKEANPRKATEAGINTGISVILRHYEKYEKNLKWSYDRGYKILLHNPGEIPRPSENHFRVRLEDELSLSVNVHMMTTSENLHSYPASTRQCYFTSERHLAYFKEYSRHSCELECLANYIVKKCHCAAVNTPRFESTPLCGAESRQCVNNASDELDMEEILWAHKTQRVRHKCDCLPACTSLQYDAKASLRDFSDIHLYFRNIGKDVIVFHKNMVLSKVSIYFEDVQFITRRTSELFSFADFIANCGGLLSLFSGVSVLSFVEIVYYITLRFHTNMKAQKQNTEDDAAEYEHHPETIEQFKSIEIETDILPVEIEIAIN